MKKYMGSFILCFFSLFLIPAIATQAMNSDSTISLYEQANTNSKVVSTIKAGQALIPIFSQGDWIKVGDPATGNVGWINNKTLTQMGIPQLYTKTITQTNKDKNNSSYQVIQYTGPQVMNDEQLQTMFHNWQTQQTTLSQSLNQMFMENMSQFNQMMQQFNQNFMNTLPASNSRPAKD